MSGKKNTQPESKQLLGFWDVLGIGIGQMVGAGVMVLIGICIEITGAGTPLAFLAAVAMVLCPALVFAAMGSAVPQTGGMYTYVRRFLGRKASLVYLSYNVASQLLLALFATGFAEYATGLFPGINTKWLAFSILTVCYLANLFGLQIATKFQNIMVVILLAALLLFVGFGLPKVDWSVFTQPNAIMPNGGKAFLTAASLLTFATAGAETVAELGGEMKNPGKYIPFAIVFSTLIIGLLCAAVSFVATGVLPLDVVAGKSLVQVAEAVFPKWLYVFFLIGGGMFASASTLNATFSWCTKGLLVATEDGWLPKSMGKVSKRSGVPYVYLTLFYIMGAIPILSGTSPRVISMLGNAAATLYQLFPIVAAYMLYKLASDEAKNASFKFPPTVFNILITLAIFMQLTIIFFNIEDVLNGRNILVIYTLIVTAYAFIREKRVKEIAQEKSEMQTDHIT